MLDIHGGSHVGITRAAALRTFQIFLQNSVFIRMIPDQSSSVNPSWSITDTQTNTLDVRGGTDRRTEAIKYIISLASRSIIMSLAEFRAYCIKSFQMFTFRLYLNERDEPQPDNHWMNTLHRKQDCPPWGDELCCTYGRSWNCFSVGKIEYVSTMWLKMRFFFFKKVHLPRWIGFPFGPISSEKMFKGKHKLEKFGLNPLMVVP